MIKKIWNVLTSKPRRVTNGGSFKLSSLYKELKFQEILMELVIDVGGVQMYRYLLGDTTYPLQTYLMKVFKNRCDLDKFC